jgi:hypothetical protein
MKFTFTSEFIGFGSPKNTMEFEADQIGDVIVYFEQFLRGAGYHFDGYLDIVPHDENLTDEDGVPTMPEYPFMDEALVNEDSTVSPEWQATVNSLMNPPKFRASDEDVSGGSCPQCGISKIEMRGHKCWDKKCPLPESAVHAY